MLLNNEEHSSHLQSIIARIDTLQGLLADVTVAAPDRDTLAHELAAISAALHHSTPPPQPHETLDHYRTIAELLSDYRFIGHITDTGQLNLEWITPTFIQFIGYSFAELQGTDTWKVIVYLGDHAAVNKHLARVIARQADEVDFRIITHTGDIRWLRSSMFPIWDAEAQRVRRVVGAGRDISEYKRLEEAQRIDQTRLEERVAERTAALERANSALRYEISERLRIEHEMRQIQAELEERVKERTIELTDSNMMLRWEIGDRIRAEEQLRESEERYRRLVELSPEAITVSSGDTFLYINPSGARLLGANNPDDLIGRSIWPFIAPEHHNLVRQRTEAVHYTSEPNLPSEEVMVRTDGTLVKTEVMSIPITYQGRRAILNVTRDITERKLAEERITTALREKEVLLHEIHHRVKNNLQVISSLLDLQAAQLNDEQMVLMLRESQNRVRTIAMIHEKLYQSADLARIEFGSYVQELATHLLHSYTGNSARIALKVAVDSLSLSVDSAIPCGLIINELVSNALKHAFPADRHGVITVAFHTDTDGKHMLQVSDNGVGFAVDLDVQHPSSLGLQLVRMLVRQIKGQVVFTREEGACVEVQF